MGLSNPRIIFGVHSATPYNKTTYEFYGILKVLGGSSLEMSPELVKLSGGSQKFPWAIEDGAMSAELSLKPKEYPDFLFELFLGKKPTTSSVDSDGAATTLTNRGGTSVMNASTGIASVSVKAAAKADLKFGKYVVKAASATTVDVYFSSDIDLNRGTDGEYQDDLLKITTSALTITAETPVEIPGFGLELTGGDGTIGMTEGDTASFEVKPPSTKSMEVIVGGASDSLPEFGCIVMAQKRSNGEMFEVDLFRCKGAGLPLGFEENSFSEADLKAEAFYDSVQNGICKIRHVTPA